MAEEPQVTPAAPSSIDPAQTPAQSALERELAQKGEATFVKQAFGSEPENRTPDQEEPNEAAAKGTPPAPAKEGEPAPSASPYLPKKAQDWKKLKESKSLVERERDELKARLAEIEPKMSSLPAVDALKKERDALAAELKRVAVERSPEFNAKFKAIVEPIKSQIQIAAGKDAPAILAILDAPMGPAKMDQLESLTSEMSGFRQNQIGSAFAAYENARQQREIAIADSLANWESNQQRAAAENERLAQERDAILQREFNKQLASWQDPENRITVLTPIEGNDDHNNAVQQRIERAMSVLDENAPDLKVAGAFWAAVGPDLAAAHSQSLEQITKLESELNKIRGVKPKISADAAPSAAAGDDEYNPLNEAGDFGKRIYEEAIKGGFRSR